MSATCVLTVIKLSSGALFCLLSVLSTVVIAMAVAGKTQFGTAGYGAGGAAVFSLYIVVYTAITETETETETETKKEGKEHCAFVALNLYLDIPVCLLVLVFGCCYVLFKCDSLFSVCVILCRFGK